MRRYRITALAIIADLATSCGSSPQISNMETPNLNVVAPEQGLEVAAPTTSLVSSDSVTSSEVWQARTDVDPMSDRRSMVAEIDVPGSAHDIRITARCDVGSLDISYQIDGFDKEGNSEAFDASEGRGLYNRSITYNSVRWRPDAGESHLSTTNEPRFTNRVDIPSYQAIDAAVARTLTLEVFFPGDNEVYRIDQSQLAFRRTLSPCLDGKDTPQKPAPSFSEQVEPAASTMPTTAAPLSKPSDDQSTTVIEGSTPP